ncbi:MAG: SRPBCC family protein [Xanthobacteraceae bacterium]|nr:SRPBCC family protein [Xanthobacteraceae bacterium]
MKLVAIIFGVFLLAIAGVLGYAATRPDVFEVRRTASIKAPPDKIFPLINDFKSWTAWSPYEKKDPAMKRTYSATTSGKGATYAWDGDKNVGSGSMEIMNAPAPSRVTIKLDFTRPFEAHNIADFTLQPVEGGTNVTWSMTGPTPFFGKILHVFVDVDKMVGRDFEAGLANLKAIAEK